MSWSSPCFFMSASHCCMWDKLEFDIPDPASFSASAGSATIEFAFGSSGYSSSTFSEKIEFRIRAGIGGGRLGLGWIVLLLFGSGSSSGSGSSNNRFFFLANVRDVLIGFWIGSPLELDDSIRDQMMSHAPWVTRWQPNEPIRKKVWNKNPKTGSDGWFITGGSPSESESETISSSVVALNAIFTFIFGFGTAFVKSGSFSISSRGLSPVTSGGALDS